MKRLLVILLLLSAGLNVGLIYKQKHADSAPPLTLSHHGADRRPERMGEALHLSAGQEQVMDRVQDEMSPMMKEHHRHMHTLRVDLHQALLAPELDMVQVRHLTAEMSSSRARLDSLITERLIRELPTLSPEQRMIYLQRAMGEGRGRRR